MTPIGFRPTSRKKEEKMSEVLIEDIEREFREMISALQMDEEVHVRFLSIEEKIRKELIKLYKQVRELEKKIEQRNTLLQKCHAYVNDYPEQSLKMINELNVIDDEINREGDALFREIHKHTLPDTAEIFKGAQLSEEQIKHIRTLAITLGNRLNALYAPINQAVQYQSLEQLRRDILSKHPNLKSF